MDGSNIKGMLGYMFLQMTASSLQALLLHPDFAKNSTARHIRANLTPIIIILSHKYAKCTNFHHFVKSIFPAMAIATTLEWGIVKGPYYKVENSTRATDPPNTAKGEIKEKVEYVVSLYTGVRGIGWNFGMPRHKLPRPYTTSDNPWIMILKMVQSCIFHGVCVYLTESYSKQLFEADDWSMPLVIPSWEGRPLPVSCLLVGAMSWFNLYATNSYYIDLVMATSATFIMLLHINPFIPEYLRPSKPDTKNWLPAFDTIPWPVSLTDFWSRQWHVFLSRQIYFHGVQPFQLYVTPLLGKKISGYLGILGGFLVSALIHEYAAAISEMRKAKHSMFLNTTILFLLNGVGIILEKIFTDLTRKKVGGIFGRIWALLFLMTIGFFQYREWIERGLVLSSLNPFE